MKLSIITINRNDGDGLRKTIESVLAQTFNGIEFIIIDGNSKDNSLEVINEFKSQLSFWVSEPDSGIYNAMNKGILASCGEYLLFLNSGDFLADPKIIESIFQQDLHADIIYGDMNNILPNNERQLVRPLLPHELSLSYFYTNTRATINHPSAFIKKSLFSNGLYDESYKIIADNKFFIQKIVFENCSVHYMPIVISDFNLNGLSSREENFSKVILERERIFKELLPSRVFNDYVVFFKIKDSNLLNPLITIEQNSGKSSLIEQVILLIFRLYCFIKKIK